LLMLSKKDQTVDKILDLVPDILNRFSPKKNNKKENK